MRKKLYFLSPLRANIVLQSTFSRPAPISLIVRKPLNQLFYFQLFNFVTRFNKIAISAKDTEKELTPLPALSLIVRKPLNHLSSPQPLFHLIA